jgi:hypothetical protein
MCYCLNCQSLTVGVKLESTSHDITRGKNVRTIREQLIRKVSVVEASTTPMNRSMV